MIKNLQKYFLSNYEFYLENIDYRHLNNPSSNNNLSLNCIDHIDCHIKDNFLLLTLTRKLEFEPSSMFYLSISYNIQLEFNKKYQNEIDWNKVNLSEEFRQNGDFVLNNILNRITLLISEITSSYGQTPLNISPFISKE